LGTVKLSQKALERFDIKTKKVISGRLDSMVEAVAEVQYDINRIAHISPLVRGRLSKLYAKLGDSVEKGDLLARFHSTEVGKARAEFEEAKAGRSVAKSHFERAKKLRPKGIISEKDFIEAKGKIEQAKARYRGAKAHLETYGVGGSDGPLYPIRSPISGEIVEQKISAGETKGPEDKILTVADSSKLWVVGKVSEKDVGKVEKGMKAVVTLQAFANKRWETTVDWIDDRLRDDRVLPVRVTVDNKEGQIRPKMFGNIHLVPKQIENPLPLVPVDAVQQHKGKEVVFTPTETDGVYQIQPVELGTHSGGLVEVLSGLSLDTEIVTQGAFNLKTAARMQ
jgi:cobalt-zinc-cadmium efflux system membrane fusion protein